MDYLGKIDAYLEERNVRPKGVSVRSFRSWPTGMMPENSTKNPAYDRRFKDRGEFLQEYGDQAPDASIVLRLWREYFSPLLNTEGDYEPAPQNPGDAKQIGRNPSPPFDEMRMAISGLKKTNAQGNDGLHAQLFKDGSDKLVKSMHLLRCEICAMDEIAWAVEPQLWVLLQDL